MTSDERVSRLEDLLARALVVIERLESKLAANENPTLSLDEAGAAIGCSRTQLFRLARSGHLIMVTAGKRTRVTRASLDQYLENLPRRRRQVVQIAGRKSAGHWGR